MSAYDTIDGRTVAPIEQRLPGRGVLDGAFRLLDVLARAESGAGLSELARRAGLPKASAHRLLEQLVELGAVQRHQRRYYVGPALGRLGNAWQPHPDLQGAAHAPLRRLSRLTSSATFLHVLRGRQVRIVSMVGSSAIQFPMVQVYEDLPLHTAAGQVLLLAQDPAGNDPPAAFNRAEWHRVRAEYRSTSVAYDRGRVLPGVVCVAAPVHRHGRTVACVAATLLRPSVPPGLAELVQRTASDVSRTLDHR